MQLTAVQEQIERVIPTWCMENGFGEDPVTLSTFTELAVRLLSILPSEPSQDACMPSLAQDLRLGDDCLLSDTVTDDSTARSLLQPYAKSEGFPKVAAPGPSPRTKSATTTHEQSPLAEWMPDCSGDFRTLFYGDAWWVAGHYMMYPARNETDAERLCQELVTQN